MGSAFWSSQVQKLIDTAKAVLAEPDSAEPAARIQALEAEILKVREERDHALEAYHSQVELAKKLRGDLSERCNQLREMTARRDALAELPGLAGLIAERDRLTGQVQQREAEIAELRKQKNLLKWAVDSARIAVTSPDGTVTASYSYDDVQRIDRENQRLRLERDQLAEQLPARGAALAAANQELAALRQAAAQSLEIRQITIDYANGYRTNCKPAPVS